jgi:hypothetical protein
MAPTIRRIGSSHAHDPVRAIGRDLARLRQARTVLDDEHGTSLSEDAFVAQLCSAVLDSAPATEPSGRAKFQVAMTVCARCQQGWQEGAGVQVPVAPSVVDRALCDAQHIGSIDGNAPERAYQDIPPSVARSCGAATVAAAVCRAAGPPEGWSYIILSVAPTVAVTTQRISSWHARVVISHTTPVY